MTPAPEDEFARLFRAQHPHVLAYLRRRLPSDVAEDLAAETFLVAWRRWGEVPARARPWLFTVARNLMLEAARAAGRQRSLHLRVATAPTPSGEQPEHYVEALDARHAWARLSEPEREVIALVAWDGLTGAEAATVLGCTRATFTMRLHRARGRLRAALDGPPDPAPSRRAALEPSTVLLEGDLR